jgi:hypothetical protein
MVPDVTSQPPDSPADESPDTPAGPPQYSPELLRLIKIARTTRDLLIVVMGIALIVTGIVVRVPAGGDFNDAWIIGLIMVVGFGIGALWHAAFPFERTWPRWRRFLISLAGIGLGWALLAYPLGGTGVLGERAQATLTNCGPSTEHMYLGHEGPFEHRTSIDLPTIACDAVVRWPDGSRETLNVTGRQQCTVVSLVKPDSATSWAVDEGPAYPWPDALALGAVGGLMILQGAYSILVLIVDGLLGLFRLIGLIRPRRSAAAMPPGQLPV